MFLPAGTVDGRHQHELSALMREHKSESVQLPAASQKSIQMANTPNVGRFAALRMFAVYIDFLTGQSVSVLSVLQAVCCLKLGTCSLQLS